MTVFRNTIGRMRLDMVFLLFIQLCVSSMWHFRHVEDCKKGALTRSFIFAYLWNFTLCLWPCRNAIKSFWSVIGTVLRPYSRPGPHSGPRSRSTEAKNGSKMIWSYKDALLAYFFCHRANVSEIVGFKSNGDPIMLDVCPMWYLGFSMFLGVLIAVFVYYVIVLRNFFMKAVMHKPEGYVSSSSIDFQSIRS